MFNTDEDTKGEGDKESKGDDGNTDNSGVNNIERMNQQREEDQDQRDYKETGEVTDQVEMMWQTNEENFKDEMNKISDPQIEYAGKSRDLRNGTHRSYHVARQPRSKR